jgi:hypothetical protein
MRLHRSPARLAQDFAALVGVRLHPAPAKKVKERGCDYLLDANDGPAASFAYWFGYSL